MNKTNKARPNARWVAKEKVISLADLLDDCKETFVVVRGQRMLATNDGSKVYVLRPQVQEGWESNI